jgi:hypothetical protein
MFAIKVHTPAGCFDAPCGLGYNTLCLSNLVVCATTFINVVFCLFFVEKQPTSDSLSAKKKSDSLLEQQCLDDTCIFGPTARFSRYMYVCFIYPKSNYWHKTIT